LGVLYGSLPADLKKELFLFLWKDSGGTKTKLEQMKGAFAAAEVRRSIAYGGIVKGVPNLKRQSSSSRVVDVDNDKLRLQVPVRLHIVSLFFLIVETMLTFCS
jgi:hypothetical protein